MESKINKQNIGQFSKQFAKFARKTSACENVYFVTGAKQAGKSVFVGLLCGRELALMQDTQTMINIIVESQNRLHQYSPIHCDSQNNVAAIEIFLLEQDNEEIPIQIAKLAMTQTVISLVKQIGFIILIEDSQKQSALNHIELFLKLLGITQNQANHALNIIKPLTYFVITKVEESLESYIQLFEQLINQTENQNVHELLRFMIDSSHIFVIPLEDPSPALGQSMRQSLQLHKFQPKSMLDILSNSTLKSQQLSLDSINNILLHVEKIVSLVLSMLMFSGGDKKTKQSYEKIARQIYSDSKHKNNLDTMLGNWSKNNFVNPNLSELSSKKSSDQLKLLLDVVSAILANIQIHSPTAKKDLKQIQSQLEYFSSLTYWLKRITAPAWVNQNAVKLITFFNSNQQPKVEGKPQPEPKTIKSKALAQFCKFLENCKNNGDVLRQCIERLREDKNNSLAPFQWRLVRDLLQDCESSLNLTFLPQLIDLTIYMNDDYHCQLYIKKALWPRVLTEQYILSLIKTIRNSRPALCQLLVDYILGVTNSKQIFDNFMSMKAKLKNINQQLFLQRQKQQGQLNNIICQNYQLITTYNKIVENNRDNAKFMTFLQGTDYQNYLTPPQ